MVQDFFHQPYLLDFLVAVSHHGAGNVKQWNVPCWNFHLQTPILKDALSTSPAKSQPSWIMAMAPSLKKASLLMATPHTSCRPSMPWDFFIINYSQTLFYNVLDNHASSCLIIAFLPSSDLKSKMIFHIPHIDMDTWISMYILIYYIIGSQKNTIPTFSQSCIILRTTHFSGQVKHNVNPLGNLTSSQRFCCLSSSEGSSITASVMVSCKARMNQFENLENQNGLDPNNLPAILTYRHLIGGHILLIKEVNTLHLLTSVFVTRLWWGR